MQRAFNENQSLVDEDGTGKPGKRHKTLGEEVSERERETRRKKRGTRRGRRSRVKESKTKREIEREGKNTYKTGRRRTVLSESRKGLDEDGRTREKKGERSKSSLLSLVHESVNSSSHSREREEVKETVGGRKRE